MNQQYPSMLLEKAVGEFAKLPGCGTQDRHAAGIASAQTGYSCGRGVW